MDQNVIGPITDWSRSEVVFVVCGRRQSMVQTLTVNLLTVGHSEREAFHHAGPYRMQCTSARYGAIVIEACRSPIVKRYGLSCKCHTRMRNQPQRLSKRHRADKKRHFGHTTGQHSATGMAWTAGHPAAYLIPSFHAMAWWTLRAIALRALLRSAVGTGEEGTCLTQHTNLLCRDGWVRTR